MSSNKVRANQRTITHFSVALPPDPPDREKFIHDPAPLVMAIVPSRRLDETGVSYALLARMLIATTKGKSSLWVSPNCREAQAWCKSQFRTMANVFSFNRDSIVNLLTNAEVNFYQTDGSSDEPVPVSQYDSVTIDRAERISKNVLTLANIRGVRPVRIVTQLVGERHWLASLSNVSYHYLASARGTIAKAKHKSLGTTTLLEWASKYFPINFSLPPSKLHLHLNNELTTLHTKRGSRIAEIGPRLSAKSTWITFLYPLFCVCEELERYIMMMSDTATQTELMLQNIRDELESNALLEEDYPHVFGKGETWRDDRIVTRNGVMIEALGTGSKIRGRRKNEVRPTLILIDDPENDELVLNPVRRAKTMRWFNSALMKVGSVDTNVIIGSSTLHRECLIENVSKTPGWKSKRWASIIKWPKNMDMWVEWEKLLQTLSQKDAETAAEKAKKFYVKHKEKMDDGAVVLWPESESLYALMLMRATEGHNAFESEKQSKPINPDMCEWSEALFSEHIWFEEWPKVCTIKTMALDPSKGKLDKLGDYSCIVEMARDEFGLIYIKASMKRRDTTAICEDAVWLSYNFKPDAFAVETNQFQSLLAQDILEEARRLGTHVPIVEVENTVNKKVRIRRIGTFLSQKKLRFFNDAETLMVVEQLRDFPIADHDDGPDAIEMGLRVMIDTWNGRASDEAQLVFEVPD